MDSSRAARWVTLLLALAIALYLCWLMVQPFVSVLLWAVVLAVVFMPVHRRIERRLRRPSMSAALSTFAVIVVIVAPVSLVTIAVVGELRGLAATLSAHEGPWLNPASPIVGRLLSWIAPYVDVQQLQSPEFLKAHLESWSGTLANGTMGFVGGVASALVSTVLVVFTLYYLFRDAEAIRAAVYDVIPIERGKTGRIMTRTTEVVAASVYGVIVIAAVQGALGFFIFFVLGLPSPLLWGVVMFFLSMIPMAGAFLVWAPAAAYLAFTGLLLKAAILTAWGVLVVGSIDNVLSPRLVGKRTRMHELLIFFAVLGGIQVFGVLGVVLGPVLVAVTIALLEIIREADEPAAEAAQDETLFDRQENIRQVS